MLKITISSHLYLTILALISIYLSIAQLTGAIDIQSSNWLIALDMLIWISFTIEYFYKLIKAENKKEYILTNKLDFLSVIPVPIIALFTNSSILYVLRLVRLLAFFDQIIDSFKAFAKHKGVSYAIYVLVMVVTMSSFGIYAVEKGTTVNTIGDAFWWAIVTVSTTGFGDIAPKTPIGRMIATVLMFTGIAVFGVVMSTIGSMLTEKKENISESQETIDLTGLTDEQKISVKNFVNYLKNS